MTRFFRSVTERVECGNDETILIQNSGDHNICDGVIRQRAFIMADRRQELMSLLLKIRMVIAFAALFA